MVKKMTKCAYCKYNDGMVYTSIPPKYKCTITKEFHLGDDDCNVEFTPVKHGHWIWTGSCQVCSICDEEQYGVDTGRYYCPNCGAKMDGEENG